MLPLTGRSGQVGTSCAGYERFCTGEYSGAGDRPFDHFGDWHREFGGPSALDLTVWVLGG